MQILHEDWLRVRNVGTEQDDQIALNNIKIGDGGGAVANAVLQRAGAWCVTDARRVINVIRPEEAHHLLDGVVHLVHDAACGEEKGNARRARRLNL